MASNIVFDGTKGISLPSFTTTEKNAIVSPATGATVFDTTQNRQNVYAGGTWNAGLNSGTAVASTSGTSIDFTSIPSWVKRITVMFRGVSTSGTAPIVIQIGSGSVTTTGYAASVTQLGNGAAISSANTTSAFYISNTSSASYSFSGIATLALLDASSNVWTWCSNMGSSATAQGFISGGHVALSGVLDRVRITNTSTDTFDAGSINILYE